MPVEIGGLALVFFELLFIRIWSSALKDGMKYSSRALAFLFFAASGAFAIELPAVFSDHMVLQRDRPVPVWGRGATPGADVVVEFSGQTLKTQAEEDGSWQVRLEPLATSANGQKLTIRSGDMTRDFSDVLVGEVWKISWNLREDHPLCEGAGHLSGPAVHHGLRLAVSAGLPGICPAESP